MPPKRRKSYGASSAKRRQQLKRARSQSKLTKSPREGDLSNSDSDDSVAVPVAVHSSDMHGDDDIAEVPRAAVDEVARPPPPPETDPAPSTSASISDIAKDPGSAATTRKFRLIEQFAKDDEQRPQVQQGLSNSFCPVQVSTLSRLFHGLACTECGARELYVVPDEKTDGFVMRISVICGTCNAVINQTYTSERLMDMNEVEEEDRKRGKTGFEANRRVVAAMLSMGEGYSGLKKLCQFMDMPCPSLSTFQAQQQDVIENVQAAINDILRRSGSVVRQLYMNLDPSLNEDSVIDIAVSYDGSWLTRGHTSNIGLGAVIEILTGLVIDFEVLSKYCHGCTTVGSKYDPESEDYRKWKEKHKCDKNYEGSSGMMEVRAAEVLWRRSIDKFNLRYTTMLSDGDSKSFDNLNSLIDNGELYDVHHKITKEECINHVCKRLGTALRNKRKEKSKEGVSLGGRGWGKLTDGKITILQQYYTRAVRTHNTSVDDMRSAIMATWFHCMSTDEDPHHLRCPSGLDSWCFFQRALANKRPKGLALS